jgi:hypothetical protein
VRRRLRIGPHELALQKALHLGGRLGGARIHELANLLAHARARVQLQDRVPVAVRAARLDGAG